MLVQTIAVTKTIAVTMGEVISVSGMANGPWLAVPVNIRATTIKQHKKSGGKQYIRSCSGEEE